MTYNVTIICDDCGAQSSGEKVQADARYRAKKNGWLLLQDPVAHFCNTCAPKHRPEPKPLTSKPTQEQGKAKQWDATVARLKVVLRLRREGGTLKECGKALGVSASRAAQMISQAERTEAHGWKHRSQWARSHA